MNVLASDDIFISFLQHAIDRGLIEDLESHYFNSPCILNSFTALNNLQEENEVFHKKVHRDIRGYSNDIPILLNMLVMIDDFTVENGGTEVLPYSHLIKSHPTNEFRNDNHIPLTGKSGDIIIWNSNIFHKSGTNKTHQQRRALPITLSLPYYKQLLDYPRAIGYNRKGEFSEKMQELLGYHSIVPSNIDEWYRPRVDNIY